MYRGSEKDKATRRRYLKAHPEQRKKAKPSHHKNHWARRRVVLGSLKAGGCSLCGYNKCLTAIEFHHVNADKEVKPSAVHSIDVLRKEAAKCIVVCANCHREIHAGQIEGLSHVETIQESGKVLPLLSLMVG